MSVVEPTMSVPTPLAGPPTEGAPAPAPTAEGGAPPPAEGAPPAAPAEGTAAPAAPPAEGAPQSSRGAGGAAGSQSVIDIMQKYQGEFQQTFDGLKQRAIAFQDSAPQIVNQTRDAVEAPKNELIATVQDMGDVSTPPLAVLNHLSWAAVLVFFANVSATISGYVLNPFIGTFVGGFGASIAALVALPYYAKYSIDQDVAASVSESSIRFKLLGLALGEGALVGFVLSNSYLSAAPLAALFPLITAVAYPFAAEKFGAKRQMLVGGAVGVALGANLALGLLTGNLTATYFLASALYAGATFVTLQYIFKNVTSAEAPAFQYQFGLLVAFVGINLLTHFLFGMNPEAYAQYVNRPVSA